MMGWALAAASAVDGVGHTLFWALPTTICWAMPRRVTVANVLYSYPLPGLSGCGRGKS